jgi:hypothetical protein
LHFFSDRPIFRRGGSPDLIHQGHPNISSVAAIFSFWKWKEKSIERIYPPFSSITNGTLCGKWPDIGLWPIVLSLADRHGVVDVTAHYLSVVTGLELSEVESCMRRFCEPDPGSRSSESNGARLILISPETRSWGWQIVNHGKYREKARLQSQNSAQVADGRNAEKVRRYKERKAPAATAVDRRQPPLTAGDTRRHPETPVDTRRHSGTPADTLSDSDRNKDKMDPDLALSELSNSKNSTAVSADVRTVFDHWRTTHGHPRASLDAKRTRVIRAALKNYSVADVCLAITGYLNSPHHMGINDSNTKYDELALLLRDAAHIDAGLRFHAEPPRLVSQKTARTIAVSESWVPPELRDAAK